MKICTYNIWESNTNIKKRIELLKKELIQYDIDFLALQEVKDYSLYMDLKTELNYNYGHYFDGLALLSNESIELEYTYKKNNSYMLRVTIGNKAFTVVHFDYEFSKNRNEALNDYFDHLEQSCNDDEFILGDFNESPEENIHFELVMSDFKDYHKEYSHKLNEFCKPTLDMNNNPRWKTQKTDEEPLRVDWIMGNTVSSYKILDVKLIGVTEVNGLTPSDHYGVLVTLEDKGMKNA